MSIETYSKREQLDNNKLIVENHIVIAKDLKSGEKCVNFRKYNIHTEEFNILLYELRTDRHFYEVIYPQQIIKPYFDCEMDDVEECDHKRLGKLFLDTVITFIEEKYVILLDYDDFSVLDSCRPNKLSYHFIIQNHIYFRCVADWKIIAMELFSHIQNNVPELVWGSKNEKTIMDKLVFGKCQNFRCVNQSKKGKDIILKNVADIAIRDLFVGLYFGADDRMLIEVEQPEKFSKTVRNTPENIVMELDRNVEIENNFDYIFIDEALNRGLLKKKASDRDEWLKFGFAIKFMFGKNGEDLFIKFSKISPLWEENEKWNEKDIRKQYEKFSDSHCNQITIGTIKHWVREEDSFINADIIKHIKNLKKELKKPDLIDNYVEPVLDENELTNYIIPLQQLEVCGDYDIAIAIKNCFGTNFKCVSIERNLWYYFEDYSWKTTEAGTALRKVISTGFADVVRKRKGILKNILRGIDPMDISHARITTEFNRLEYILQRLSKTNDKRNIMTELRDILYDPDFETGFNSAKNVLPIKGGLLFDMITCKSRDRTIDDKFNYECPVSFINPLNSDIDEYFNQLFCGDLDTKKVFLDSIKSTFSGTILRYFFICSGDGSNGKSLLFKLLKRIFGKGMDVLSDKVVIASKTQSNLNTELEKLDKIRLGYISELPDGGKLNEKIIKGISGGDDFDVRALHTANRTMTPTATLWGLFNSLPEFKTEKAMINRIINFPFNANFEVDVSFEEKMMGKIDAVFSYIMSNGEIKNAIISSPAMAVKKQEYIADQSNPLLDYFDTNIVGGVFPATKRKDWCIKQSELMQSYHSWCSMNNKRNYEKTKTTFSKELTRMGIKNTESNHILWYENIKYKPYEIEDDEEQENAVVEGDYSFEDETTVETKTAELGTPL